MMNTYDIIYVGAGTANMFSLLHLIRLGKHEGKHILVLDKGQDIETRTSVTTGYFGAGVISDCKIILSPETGGEILNHIDKKEVSKLEESLLTLIDSFTSLKNYTILKPEIPEGTQFGNFNYVSNRVLHMGTDYGKKFALATREFLRKFDNIHFKFNEEVKDLEQTDTDCYCLYTSKGCYFSEKIIYATGKSGVNLTFKMMEKLNIEKKKKKAQVGVRVEVPAEITKHWTDIFYDFKFSMDLKEGSARSFCVSPYGQVIKEDFFGLRTYNGGSNKVEKTEFTNFGIIVTPNDINGFSPLEYQKTLAKKANELEESDTIVNWQTWLMDKDIYNIFYYAGVYKILTTWMIEFELICPGFLKSVKIHVPEIKYLTDGFDLTNKLNLINHPNFYCIGDSSYGRGIYQAAIGGILVAENI